MSTDPKPTDQDADLGITFTEKQSPTPDMREGGLKMPTTPTIEEVVKDTEATKQGGVFNVSEAENAKHDLGTIVTDKKRRRASLRDNVESAWNEWWGEAKKVARPALKTMSKPKQEMPKISKVENRIDVVETAATHAAMAPKDDHKVAIEKIKTFKRDVERVTGAPFTVKTEKKSEPAWTHQIDTAKVERPSPPPTVKPVPRPVAPLDLRDSMVAPVVEKHIQKDIADYTKKPAEKKVEVPKRTVSPTQVAYMHIPGTVERKDKPQAIPAHIAPLVQIKKEEVRGEVPLPVSQKEVVGYVAREEAKEAAELAKRPIEPRVPPAFSPAPTPPEEISDAEDTTFRGTVSTDAAQEKKNRAYLTPVTPLFSPRLVLTAVSGVAVIGFVVVVVLVGRHSAEPEIVAERETPEIETLFEVESQSAIPLTGSVTDFFSSFVGTLSTTGGDFVQLYPTIEEGTGTKVASSEEFFTLLQIPIPEKMLRVLGDTLMLGGVRTSSLEPFIVIRSYNFDALFAGMLEWEPQLRQSFSPLFDASYVEEDVFTDAVIANRPARVLKDVRGEPVLLYTIVEKNIVVISSSREALEQVIDEL